MQELVPIAGDFDFSKYQPGDVLCISRAELVRRGGIAPMFMILAALACAAGKAGLLIEPQVTDDEVRVVFK